MSHDMFPKAEKDIQMLKSIKEFKIKEMTLFSYEDGKEKYHTSGCQLTFADDTTVLLGKRTDDSRTIDTPWPVTSFKMSPEY